MIGIKSTERPAPAYQEYASDILANRSYRAMTFAERGLWDTIRKECWVNGSVPSSLPELAKYLGIDLNEITRLMSPNVLIWFKVNNADMTCPEIDAYRSTIERRRQSMVDGGRNGGKKAQENRRRIDRATLEGSLKPLRRDEMRRVELNRKESSKAELNNTEHKDWIDDFNHAEQLPSNTYLMQSKGY